MAPAEEKEDKQQRAGHSEQPQEMYPIAPIPGRGEDDQRAVAGLCALFMRPGRVICAAIVFKPSTLLSLYRASIQRKYRHLFSSTGPTKPGPKGLSQEVIAVVDGRPVLE